jgi:maltose alpha-D-glucosyltransferase/alpha-amylase
MSMPGTPIIYYGDEIGMGDNIFLGDRNGVRTPMQWSDGKNAGFSDAHAQALFAPVISDPPYGYQGVNVDAQERTPTSLLRWMRRLIAVRKQFKAFGRGTQRFLETGNQRVLVFLREYEDETILCVNNLSRYAQPVELDLRDFAGRVPVEVWSEQPFPSIGELPYFFTLGPHNFLWFRLVKADELGEGTPPPPPRRSRR